MSDLSRENEAELTATETIGGRELAQPPPQPTAPVASKRKKTASADHEENDRGLMLCPA